MNKSHSLGIDNSREINANIGLVQAFAEIDLQQVKFISDAILTKKLISKKDLAQIEPQTILTGFKKETFFSLFYEQAIVYETAYDQLNEGEHSILPQFSDESLAVYLRSLSYVLEKPTPIRVKEEAKIADMSILKRCLLFNDIKAAVNIYKLARLTDNIDFEDYISTLEDLEIIVKRLPA